MVMPKNQKIRTANKHRADKIKLEAAFVRVLRSIFNKISNDLVKEYKDGKTLSAAQFQNDFFDALQNQYSRVNKKVNISYVNAKTDNGTQINDQSFLNFESLSLGFISARIAYILATTQNDINRAINSLVTSENPNNINSLKRFFLDSSLYRSDLIGITETQNAFELKKSVISDNFLTFDNHRLEKSWITILDGREREAHADAFDQTVPSNGLFIVMQEQLKYPGDTSHGATPSNICNCRCSAVYSDGIVISAPGLIGSP